MKRNLQYITFLMFTITLIFFLSLDSHAKSQPQKSINSDQITIKDSSIFLNRNPFITRGVIFEGFLEPISWLEECINKKWDSKNFCSRHLDTRDYFYGKNIYKTNNALNLAIKNWNINTIRFNISQTALDPTSTWYNTEYVKEIQQITQIAREKKLIVILAIFSASNRNAPIQLQNRNPYTPLSNEHTLNTALELGKLFGSDEGVIIELLNEPWGPTPTREEGWSLMYKGGKLKNPKSRFYGTSFTGNQDIITQLRKTGAKNPIIVQGLYASFENPPNELIDPLHKIIYSVHPFFVKAKQNANVWDRSFGKFAQTHPFIITAWDAHNRDEWCNLSGVQTVTDFLSYLKKRNIGLIVYAFDVPYTITRDFQSFADEASPSTTKCQPWGGAGELVQQYFNQ